MLMLTKPLTVTLGLSLCGVSAYFLYLYLTKDDDDDFIDTFEQTSKFKVIEIPISTDVVKVLIGRNGNHIKQIQEQTNTRIHFKDNDEHKVCVIKGSMEACNVAENVIQEFLSNQPLLECEDMWVPSSCVARIIGRNGDRIREISLVSGAGIVIDDNKASNSRRCTIRGTSRQILVAKSLIQEIIEKTKNMDTSLLKREPRVAKQSPVKETSPKIERITSPIPSETQFEVYVSAMIDPSRFWLQIVGPKATQLDVLVEEMSEYYKKEENRDNHVLDDVAKGDLVAAIFKYDNKWYRAEILNINDNGKIVELYFVDYGDIDSVPVNEVYELRTDFLRLHFQAIECYLARVEPVGDTWSLEAIDKFEEWTHVGQWKKLSAKISGYTIREKTRAKREGSPIPGVDLFNVNDEQDIDIAQELVKQGYAIFKREFELVSSSRATSNSNISVASSS